MLIWSFFCDKYNKKTCRTSNFFLKNCKRSLKMISSISQKLIDYTLHAHKLNNLCRLRMNSI